MVINRDAQVSRATAALIWVAMALVLADAAAYLLLIRAQGASSPDAFTVPFVAGYMVLMAVALWLSLLEGPLVALRPALRACAAAGLLVLGAFALFSVGLPIVVAGALATIAAVRALARPRLRYGLLSAIAAAVIAVTVLLGGFEVTQRLIACPPNGSVSGAGSGFITGPYSYECLNGTLTMHSGQCNSSSGGVDANGNAYVNGNC